MSLAQQNPTNTREVIIAPASTNNPWRGFIVDAAGTVTIHNTAAGESTGVVVPVIAGFNPHVFTHLTAVSGPTTVVAYR